MREPFEIVEHTADIGFVARGASLAELFANAARGFMAIAADTADVEERAELAIEVTGEDTTSLLVNFLSEILYLLDTGRFVPARCAVDSIQPTVVRARLIGESRSHAWKLIVKAVTYHEIEVSEQAGEWSARVILDI